MKKFWNSIFLDGVLFIGLGLVAALFVFGHFYPLYHTVALGLLALLTFSLLLDVVLLYHKSGITGERELRSILSNGDDNECMIHINNKYAYRVSVQVNEEVPHQLGQRRLVFNTKVGAHKSRKITYTLRPKERGEYDFGDVIVMTQTPIQLVRRRYAIQASQQVAVYPSYIHLNRYNLTNFKYYTQDAGAKKTRKIGHSTEFEQIKGYVKGDDLRHINWKASAKKNHLMVNQYTDEKAQQVFCIIDTGRAMQMPFEGLSLLDYAINTSLALSHVVVKNHDKAGLVYFNKKVEKILPADKSMSHLPKILKLLYNLKTEFFESNFEKLYAEMRFRINHRSLMLLFTNFEDMNSLKRQLPYLKGIAKNNVLLVIFFKNSELEEVTHTSSKHQREYYEKAVAEKLTYQKRQMVMELRKHGIQSLLTNPQNLTTDTISKYIEIKSRSLI